MSTLLRGLPLQDLCDGRGLLGLLRRRLGLRGSTTTPKQRREAAHKRRQSLGRPQKRSSREDCPRQGSDV